LKNIPSNGLKVFSTFSCGGGSSMGYKLAGFELLGNCEIDPQMMKIYKKNHKPKYPYFMDIREFNQIPLSDLPEELKN
ncbi:DNA cytosine methyltransferase, partial [Bacillus pumilus]